jgi:hypothetical protein
MGNTPSTPSRHTQQVAGGDYLISKDQHGGRLICGATPQQTKFLGSVHHVGGR